jgi:hypothetical protein
VLLLRFASTAPFWAARGITLPHWLDAPLSSALFASFAAKLAIGMELFIALGMWLPKSRRLALWVGLLFHFSIEVSARVELFSWLMVASYLSFVVPELHERRIELNTKNPLGRALLRALPWLDWCARFQIAERASDQPASFQVTNREGRTEHGLRGAALLAEAIPVLFPLWLPLALLARLAAR